MTHIRAQTAAKTDLSPRMSERKLKSMARPDYAPQLVTPEWRQRTTLRLEDLGMSAPKLARQLTNAGTSATGQSVRDLLDGRRKISSLVGAIDQLLSTDPPPAPPPDANKARVDALWGWLDDRDRHVVADVVEGLARGRGR